MAINWTIDEQGILTIEGSGRLPDFGSRPRLVLRSRIDFQP